MTLLLHPSPVPTLFKDLFFVIPSYCGFIAYLVLRKAGHVDAALEVLREAGWVRPVPVRDGTAHGRQRKDYEINPEVYEGV